jgi:hypothetical protein
MKTINQRILKNSKKKIDILLSFGAGEELDTSLNKLIVFQIAKYRSNINQIGQDLNEFERKYRMSSEKFFHKFESGNMGDDADFFEWASLYENVILYSQRIKSLESALNK